MDQASENNMKGLDELVERAINFLYIATILASVCINIFDIFRLINLTESYILYTNIPAIFMILLSFLLKITNIISLRESFSIVVLTILANSMFSIFQSRYLEDVIISLLRESIFLALLISLSAFVVSRKLAYYVTGIYSVFIIIIYLTTRDRYILENAPVLILVFIAYTVFVNYLIYLIKQTLQELLEKNMIIKEQLEEIKAQNEELIQLNEELYIQRTTLEQKNDELNFKNIELTVSKDELKKMNDTKNKLFTVIGHDVKNPMHIILGYSNLLASRFEKIDDQKKKDYVKTIDKSINSLYNVLVNLLTWSQTQLDAVSFHPEKVDINHLISITMELYQELVKRKSINVTFSTEPGLIAFVDKNMIQVVIRNLLDNAIKYTGSGGAIHLSGEKSSHYITIHISDNGSGIPEGIRNHIFDLVDEKSRPGTQGEKGTGLGLAICKEFIEKNQGKIWFTSEEGKGTTFSISLPQ